MVFFMPKAEYLALHQGAKILEQDLYGEKVLLIENQKIIKLFRVKRFWSSSIFYPYSLRFSQNAKKLQQLNIPTIQVERQFYCWYIRRYGIIYPLLEGEPLALLLPQQDQRLYLKLARFIAHLHNLGIYFRSLHPGNILLLKNGQMGLIDIADMRFKKYLSNSECKRNFWHFFRYPEYHAYFESFGWHSFLQEYNQKLHRKENETVNIYDFLVHKKVINSV